MALLSIRNDDAYDHHVWIAGPAWRVWVLCDDGLIRFIDCEFKRYEDAYLGMRALEQSGLDTAEKLFAERDRLKWIMCAGLAW